MKINTRGFRRSVIALTCQGYHLKRGPRPGRWVDYKKVQPSFLQDYLKAFHRIQGWFQYDAALLFMAYNQLLRERGIEGDVVEIGVHHGLSTIALARLRGPDKRLVAIDLFESQQQRNVSRSGS